MSKAECRPAYLRHKLAMEAAINKKDPPRVAEVFKRKPYSSSNYTRRDGNESRRDNE